MSKITKKSLNERLLMVETLLGLHRKLPEQISVDQANNAIFRMQCALSNGREIAERQLKLKVLDQSVFDGLDEKWRFAAIVADGRALYFNKKPCGSDDITGHFVFKSDYQASFCGNDYDTTNWKNSLIERESSACEEADFLNDTISNIFDEIIDIEYFYSKITCELLEKGSSYVLAYVSGKSEQTAIENKEVAVIESMDVLFKDTNDYDWKYAVSINQQTGEPLTAKEVGL